MEENNMHEILSSLENCSPCKGNSLIKKANFFLAPQTCKLELYGN